MGLLDADAVEDLLHSSSVDKGIERTIERFINELEIDSMYVIHYEEGFMEPRLEFVWDNTKGRILCKLEEYIQNCEKWYHFDDGDLFVARATAVLAKEEREFYQGMGYETIIEYKMTNHGNHIGYISLGWNGINNISDETVEEIHVVLKLMNEVLCREYFKEVMGESEGSLFKVSSRMTKTCLYVFDEEYRITYINSFARENYPQIKLGDDIVKSIWGEKCKITSTPIATLEKKDVVDANMYIPYMEESFQIGITKVRKTDNSYAHVMTLQKDQIPESENMHRQIQGRKFIFAMSDLYKDMIAVEIRKDRYYNLLTAEVDNQKSYSRDFVLKWMAKIHNDDKQKFLECFDVNFLQNSYMKGERKKEIDFRYRTHEGVYHCMNGQIIFEQNSNKDVTVYILFQDVEQVRSERLEEEKKVKAAILAARSAAELKSQVLANISHEIRTPVNGIISMSSVARQVYKNEERLLECLDNIDKYSEHMMEVMDELLDVVRIDDDAITIAEQPFRLDSFMNRVDVAMREKIEKKNMNFSVKIIGQYNDFMGDEVRLQQAIYYLMNNAITYTPVAGSISLTAKQVAVDKKTVFMRFIIDDSGCGLTDKMKESIFGFASDSSEIVEEQHFDLSLAAKLVNLMGGQIGVTVDGSGTHLDFTIPFKVAEDTGKKTSKRKKAPNARDYSGKRILLAEDNDMSQDALKAVLEVVGFEVDAVDNGRKAVIEFISHKAYTYHAILMDVHMPLMDGREATKCIRISGKEDGSDVPIIGLMTDTTDEDIEESKKAGMQAHLGKPLDVNTLYKVLNRLIPENEDENN